MQPYLFPYPGFFKLIKSVDKFVLYDDAKYIKGGWINRNYFPKLFTFRLKKHSDYAKINECHFKDIEEDKKRFRLFTPRLNRYIYPLFVDIMDQKYTLSHNIYLTIKAICRVLKIKTPIYLSSEIPHGKFVDGIKDIIKALNGDTYVNLPGGKKLYTQEMFGNIKLEFIETQPEPSILCSL